MHSYLTDTKFAAESVITAYTREFHVLNGKIREYQQAGEWFRQWNKDTDEKGLLETALDKKSFPEQVSVMSKMAAQARDAVHQIYSLSDELKSREFATQVLCGAILQIAKQGISVVHGSLTNCPPGRLIGSQDLKTVIWQGRNQALHYEEGCPHPPVVACFSKLDADLKLGLSTQMQLKMNLATHVVDIFGWHTYSTYETDMISLLG